jgi:predicted dienelactone hydrolase
MLAARHFAFPLFMGLLTSLLVSSAAVAAQAGWRQFNVPGPTPGSDAMSVALFYPTQVPARVIPMGPFSVDVAIQAPPDPQIKGLIVLSHGIAGTELGHSSLAQALARDGWLVAALRHPGDNWKDRSLIQKGAARYFTERPQHVSRVIDALLSDPQWGDRIGRDAIGPRIGAVGHSAGGYTALALVGGEPDMPRLAAHCAEFAAQDPIFCGLARSVPVPEKSEAPGPQVASLADPRVRAVVALAPTGVLFSASSLAAIRVPAAIYEAEQDHFLVPRFHAEWIARHLPGAEVHRVPEAWHFSFMDSPSMAIVTEDGDIAANPPGFDRQAFLARLGREIPAFFDKALP